MDTENRDCGAVYRLEGVSSAARRRPDARVGTSRVCVGTAVHDTPPPPSRQQNKTIQRTRLIQVQLQAYLHNDLPRKWSAGPGCALHDPVAFSIVADRLCNRRRRPDASVSQGRTHKKPRRNTVHPSTDPRAVSVRWTRHQGRCIGFSRDADDTHAERVPATNVVVIFAEYYLPGIGYKSFFYFRYEFEQYYFAFGLQLQLFTEKIIIFLVPIYV